MIKKVLKSSIILFLSSLFLLSNSCRGTDIDLGLTGWKYSDLRILEIADTNEPMVDLISLYTRHNQGNEQIRLDLLERTNLIDYDIYIAIDSLPGGTNILPLPSIATINWDRLIIIPSEGQIQILNEQQKSIPNAKLQVWRDGPQAGIVIDFAYQILSNYGYHRAERQGYWLEVFLTRKNSTEILDRLPAIRSDHQTSFKTDVIFTFWNTFPAYTPATALRRWRGAHTGPLGGSHGLYHLLTTAQITSTPVILLDLKNSASLSALDQIGVLEIVQEMERDREIILPDQTSILYTNQTCISQGLFEEFQNLQEETIEKFGLSPSFFSYHTNFNLPEKINTKVIFLKQDIKSETQYSVKIQRFKDMIVIPIIDQKDQQPDDQTNASGLSTEIKRVLLENALKTKQDTDLILLGGSLPESTWAIPNFGSAGFKEVEQHPWIHVLHPNELLSLRSQAVSSIHLPFDISAKTDNTLEHYRLLEEALFNAPNNTLRKAAMNAYLSLSAPVSPSSPKLPTLREIYSSVVWSLLEASEWEAEPTPKSSCDEDIDHDGMLECIIAGQSEYIQVEIESGAISFVFVRSPDQYGSLQVHQLIAPSAQFISGLSDPIFWEVIDGKLFDPDVITGAFSDELTHYDAILLRPNELLLYDEQKGYQKKIILGKNQITIQYVQALKSHQQLLEIPLALDPWNRFEPGWTNMYQLYKDKDIFTWSSESGVSIQVTGTKNISMEHFNQSNDLLKKAEDPNIDYPKGHFIPNPMAVLKIPFQENLTVVIKWFENAIIE